MSTRDKDGKMHWVDQMQKSEPFREFEKRTEKLFSKSGSWDESKDWFIEKHAGRWQSAVVSKQFITQLRIIPYVSCQEQGQTNDKKCLGFVHDFGNSTAPVFTRTLIQNKILSPANLVTGEKQVGRLKPVQRLEFSNILHSVLCGFRNIDVL